MVMKMRYLFVFLFYVLLLFASIANTLKSVGLLIAELPSLLSPPNQTLTVLVQN